MDSACSTLTHNFSAIIDRGCVDAISYIAERDLVTMCSLQQPTQTPLLQSVGTSSDRKELLTAAGTHDDLDGLNDLGVYWIEPQNRCNVIGCPHHHNCEERENLVHSAGVCTDRSPDPRISDREDAFMFLVVGQLYRCPIPGDHPVGIRIVHMLSTCVSNPNEVSAYAEYSRTTVHLGWNVHMKYMLRKEINVRLGGFGGCLTGGTFY